MGFLKFDTWAPKSSDFIEDRDITIVNITPEGPMWDPNSSLLYGENEESMVDNAGDLINNAHEIKTIVDEDEPT